MENQQVNGSGVTNKSAQQNDKPTNLLVESKTIKKTTNNAMHGNLFECKLLTLFLMRATIANYEFEMTSNDPMGGKFDDVIFRYRRNSSWKYRYLQAKHKQDDSISITSSQLLDNNAEDFSLPKYFRSYCRMIGRGEYIHDCVICTNIRFNKENLKERGIELIPVTEEDNILEFGSDGKTKSFKMKIADTSKIWEWTDICILANKLKNCKTEKKTLAVRDEPFDIYHVALVNENVIDKQTQSFHQDFKENSQSLTQGAKQLREIICNMCGDSTWENWKFQLGNNFGKPAPCHNQLPMIITETDIKSFFDKFIFIVDAPNENDFDRIVLSDMTKIYRKNDAQFMTKQILDSMLEWCKKKQPVWLSPQYGTDLLLSRIVSKSKDYCTTLKKELGFTKEAIKEMIGKIDRFLHSSESEIIQISTLSPKLTAVKLFSAIETFPEYHTGASCSYLVLPSNSLEDNDSIQRWKNTVSLNGSPRIVVIVCQDSDSVHSVSYHEQFSLNLKAAARKGCKLIIICKGSGGIKDKITYKDLDSSTQEIHVLSKTVMFQGSTRTVKDLIKRSSTQNVIDPHTLLQLITTMDHIDIPGFRQSTLSSDYIKRRIMFPFLSEEVWSKVAQKLKCTREQLKQECCMDSMGKIEWYVSGERKSKIWNAILKHMNTETGNDHSEYVHTEDKLLDNGAKGSVYIISGIAGTGKSTLISNFYDHIKHKKPLDWIIRINLLNDQEDKISEFNNLLTGKEHAIEFLMKYALKGTDQNNFARSLLRHRLEISGRVSLLIDGFDEINKERQEKVINFIKALMSTQIDAIYITTRSHLINTLQNSIFQFAYKLKNFTQQDQVKCLADYWKCRLPTHLLPGHDNLKEFARLLIDALVKSLADEERQFVGIPLQCRILGECFEPLLKEAIEASEPLEPLVHKIDSNFDLAALYKLLLDTKLSIYKQDKVGVNDRTDHLFSISVERIETYLTKRAIETIFQEEKERQILMGQCEQFSSFHSNDKIRQAEKANAEFGINLGILKTNEEGNTEFLHRTYAEYFTAIYIYQGFHLDDDLHNRLLDSKYVRNFLLTELFTDSSYDGVMTFLNCLMKSLVESEKWQNAIDQRLVFSLPHRLRRVIEFFYSDFIHYYAFKNVYEGKFVNIFNFMCDCLKEGGDVFWHGFFSNADYKRRSFMDSRSCIAMNRRFIKLADGMPDNNVMPFLRLHQMVQTYELTKADMAVPSRWNNEDKRETIKFVLELLKMRSSLRKDVKFDIDFFICNAYYDSILPLLLDVRTDDEHFVRELKNALRGYQAQTCWIEGRIKSFVNLLIDLLQSGTDKQRNMIKDIRCEVLEVDPVLFIRVYQFFKPEMKSLENLQLYIEKDANGITLLHRAAFYGDLETIDKIFCIKGDAPMGNAMLEILFDDDLTPFLLAASQCNVDMCGKILNFMKRSVSAEELQKPIIRKNYLYEALMDAIEFGKHLMLRMILKSIEDQFGLIYLKDVLSSSFLKERKSIALGLCNTTSTFPTMIDFITDKDRVCSEQCHPYRLLNELFFQDIYIVNNLKIFDKEILSRMISADGFESWVKRLLNLNIQQGFDLLALPLFDKLDKGQQIELVKIITSTETDPESSYLNRWFLHPSAGVVDLENPYDKFFECIRTNLGRDILYEMVFYDGGKAIVSGLLSFHGNHLKSAILNQFSKRSKRKLVKRSLHLLPQTITEMYSTGKYNYKYSNLAAMDFVFSVVKGFANKLQLLNFIIAILQTQHATNTNRHHDKPECSVQTSVWTAYVRDCDPEFQNIDFPSYFKSLKEKFGHRFLSKVLNEMVFHNDGELFSFKALNSIKYLDDLLLVLLNYSPNRKKAYQRALIGKYLLRNLKVGNQEELREKAQIMPNIFRLLRNYSDTWHLAKFFRVILSKDIIPERKLSIWSHYILICVDWLNHEQSSKERRRDIMFMQSIVNNKVGKKYIEDLLFHEDGQLITFLLLRGNEELVSMFLGCLSLENKQKVVKSAMNNTYTIVSDSKNLFSGGPRRRYETTSANFFLILIKHTNKRKFADFVEKTFTYYAMTHFLWVHYLLSIIREGSKCTEDFVLSNVDRLFKSVLSHLPTDNCTKFIENFIDTLLSSMLEARRSLYVYISHCWFIFQKYFVNYANTRQLSQFLYTLLQVENIDSTNKSLWSDYIYYVCDEHASSRVRELLACISLKVNPEKVKELVFHSPSEEGDKVIIRAALDGDINLYKTMLAYLDQKDIEKVKCLLQQTQNKSR